MSISSFIKKLSILDVIWGRRSKIFHGIKDGGIKAAIINNTDIARERDGTTVYNIDNQDNEPMGGHFHGNLQQEIVTHELGASGLALYAKDELNNSISIGPMIVCDENGNVVWNEG